MNPDTLRRDLRLDPQLVALVNPTSFEAEQYRRLRNRVEELAVTRNTRVLAVTSAVAGEGKTVTAVNLAATLAQADSSRILLVETDLRRPALARHFSRIGAGGLAAALRDPNRIEESARTVPGSNLSVLAAQGASARAYDILASSGFAALVAKARELYDFVVLDSAPLVPVPDTVVLRRVVDGYLVVVGADSTPRGLVAEALNLLDPDSVLGFVFNGGEHAPFGYRHYYRSRVQSYVESPASIRVTGEPA